MINLVFTHYKDIFFWINIMVWICFFIIIFFVMNNFFDQNKEKKLKWSQKSIVETFSMTLFFLLVYYFILLNKFTYPKIQNYIFIQIIALAVLILWTFFNIRGRVHLKTNRANHIKIYKNHYLVNTWPYKIVRHPLYASLIWMGYSVWVIYCNRWVIVITTILFLPMMIYRARQEEKLLSKTFPEYENYKKNVWLFLPKIK